MIKSPGFRLYLLATKWFTALRMIFSKRFWSDSGFANPVVYLVTRTTFLCILFVVVIYELAKGLSHLVSLIVCVVLFFVTLQMKTPSRRSFLYLLSLLIAVIGIIYIDMT